MAYVETGSDGHFESDESGDEPDLVVVDDEALAIHLFRRAKAAGAGLDADVLEVMRLLLGESRSPKSLTVGASGESLSPGCTPPTSPSR